MVNTGSSKRSDSRFAAPRASEEASPPPQRRTRQSSCIALFSDQAGAIDLDRNRLAFVHALSQFRQGGSLGDFSDLGYQVIGKRHARHGGASFESTMQGIGHIAKL